ncbi:MAG TPA: FecR family protein [Terriglobia bacterium]|nr:FecR family protein [Terriglobia bacterium]
MGATTRRLLLPLAIGVLLVSAVPLVSQDQEYSHVRIVRLSFVEGTVTLLRPGSTNWANAAVNTPIEEGFQILTDKASFAEVQFENGSSVRVGELSLLKFDQLGRTESGDLLNKVTLDHGYGTVTARPENAAVFEVRAGDATFTPQGKAEFRVDLDQGKIRVEAFKGSVDVASPESSTTLVRNEVLEITPGGSEAPALSQNIKRDDWDAWVTARDQQEQESAATQPPGGAMPGAPAYGWSDLNQYGTWSYVNSCGYGWLPNAGIGWSPFTFGQWSTYPGFGYTWISYEPWGWLPYHYGAWQLDPTLGWAWCPTGGLAGSGLGWFWSPAIVTWYQGPGWVGWAPRPIHPIGGTGLHPPRRPAGLSAVSAQTFERGSPVTSRQLVGIDPAGATPVHSPALATGFTASLPSRPVRLSSAQQAVINGAPVRSESGFMEHVFRVSPSGGAWPHRAPQSSLAAPPAQVRSAETDYWSGRAPGSAGFSSAGARSGGGLSAGAGGGGFNSGARSGSFSPGARSGSFNSGSHAGGFSAGSPAGGGMSSGMSSAGGGGHAGGGAPAGGGGGGHH